MKAKSSAILMAAALLMAFLPKVHAVSPPPDGCYPNYTTAEGCNVLNFLTTGLGNTALGEEALFANIDGNHNTATGQFALSHNDHGENNTANGYNALVSNTGGVSNTAVGDNALVHNTTGGLSTAVGHNAGLNQDTGSGNVYIGSAVLARATTLISAISKELR
jgi:trimeric autotransporter adhesin